MSRSMRLGGIILWLFSFQVFAATSGGLLAKYLWLDIGSVLLMFMTACYLLGHSLPGSNNLALPSVLGLIVIASALMTVRFCNQLPYHWYDLMIVVSAPQVVALAISFGLSHRRYHKQLQLNS
jgi:hypothetical protein